MLAQRNRSRGWCFTWNNPPSHEDVKTIIHTWNPQYAVWGFENAPSTGTPHVQGYAYWPNARRWPKQPTGMHWTNARGTPTENFEYCSKDGDFEEIGERPLTTENQGLAGKTAWDNAWEAAKHGKLEEIPSKMRVAFYGTWKKIKQDHQALPADIDGPLDHEWHWGPAGIGKTSLVTRDNPGAYRKNLTHWWDNYNGEDVVILDDFSPYKIALTDELKHWADRYAFNAEVKHGNILIRPRKLIVTSNYPIEHIWEQDPESMQAIKRRFKQIHHNGNITLHGSSEK